MCLNWVGRKAIDVKVNCINELNGFFIVVFGILHRQFREELERQNWFQWIIPFVLKLILTIFPSSTFAFIDSITVSTVVGQKLNTSSFVVVYCIIESRIGIVTKQYSNVTKQYNRDLDRILLIFFESVTSKDRHAQKLYLSPSLNEYINLKKGISLFEIQ